MANIEVDILELHKTMLSMFLTEAESIDSYKSKLATLNQLLSQPHHLHSTRTMIENAKNKLDKKIKDILSNYSKNFYIMETAELIHEFEIILRKPKKVSFMGVVEKTEDNKSEIIRDFLRISKKYNPSDLPVMKLENIQSACDTCDETSESMEVNGFLVCTTCGQETAIAATSSSYKDVERVNVGAKYTYDKRIHFRDCINQYQGKQNSTIQEKVYNELEEQFSLHGLLVKSNNKILKFSKITKEHVLLFLKETGNSKHYEDSVLIHYVLTDKKPPDIGALETQIINDFDKLVETYEKVFRGSNKTTRKNFINNQYVLYQLLRKYKHPCDISEFNILKTVERKSYHDDICRQLFEELGWNFVSVF